MCTRLVNSAGTILFEVAKRRFQVPGKQRQLCTSLYKPSFTFFKDFRFFGRDFGGNKYITV